MSFNFQNVYFFQYHKEHNNTRGEQRGDPLSPPDQHESVHNSGPGGCKVRRPPRLAPVFGKQVSDQRLRCL